MNTKQLIDQHMAAYEANIKNGVPMSIDYVRRMLEIVASKVDNLKK